MTFLGKVKRELLPACFVAKGDGFSAEIPAPPWVGETADVTPEGWVLVGVSRDSVETAARDAGWNGRDAFELLFIARNVVLGRRTVSPVSGRLSGRLEQVSRTGIQGWAAPTAHAGEPIFLDVMINGEFYQRLRADRRRDDLKLAGAAVDAGGFETSVLLGSGSGDDEVEVLDAETGTLLDRPASIQGLPLRTADAARDRLAASLLRLRAPVVSIVVPVLAATGLPADFLERLARNTTHPARIILVLSPDLDASSAARARSWASASVQLFGIARGASLGLAINHGLKAAGRDDVVLLMPDIEVGPRWLQRLILAAHTGEKVASASAVTNQPGLSDPRRPAERPPGWSAEDCSRIGAQAAGGILPRIPAFNRACVYLRRDALDRVGDMDAEAFPDGDGLEVDWSMRCSYLGLSQILDEGTVVSTAAHRAMAAPASGARAVIDRRYGEFATLLERSEASPEFATVGHRFRLALRRAAVRPRPRCLYVISSQTGGTPQTNRDLMAALEDRYDPLLLHSDRKTLTLSRFSDGVASVLERYELAEPIEPIRHRSDEYDAVVGEWMSGHAVELLHVRHLAWHSFGLIEAARGRGISVVLSFHDFYLACPTVKLLDPTLTHCAAICTQGEADCRPELWRQDQFPFLRDRWVYNWREMAAPVITACNAFVTTSPSAQGLMIRAFPMLGRADFRIIPHGRDFEDPDGDIVVPRLEEQTLRVLVPGNLSRAKGAYLLRELVELDPEGRFEFHVAGNVDSSLKGARVVMHGAFERDDLPDIVSKIRPHVAAILSVWPETYSHTLTEMWAMGVPVVAFDLGAPGDRIRATGAGWLLPEVSAAAVHELLLRIAGDEADYLRGREAAEAWRQGEGRRYGIRAMSDAYDTLYREVIDRRRPFRPDAVGTTGSAA